MSERRFKHSEVSFTPMQLQYLETMFPQVVFGAAVPEAQMRHYFGGQAVLQAVREKTRGLNAGNIPSPGG